MVSWPVNYVAKWRRALYTGRKSLYEARLQEETSCNSNSWQSEQSFTVTCVWSPQVLGERNKIQCKTFLHKEMSQWVSIKTNRGGFQRLQGGYKLLFMTCICTKLGKVAGAWIWSQNIIYCGDNKWDYNSKRVHDCAGHLNGRSAPIWCVRRMPI
jgi:hypothetical protein